MVFVSQLSRLSRQVLFDHDRLFVCLFVCCACVERERGEGPFVVYERRKNRICFFIHTTFGKETRLLVIKKGSLFLSSKKEERSNERTELLRRSLLGKAIMVGWLVPLSFLFFIHPLESKRQYKEESCLGLLTQ